MPQSYHLQSVGCSVEVVAFHRDTGSSTIHTIELRVDSGFDSVDSRVSTQLQRTISDTVNNTFGYDSSTQVQQQTEKQVSASVRDLENGVETIAFDEFASVVAEGIQSVSSDEELSKQIDVSEAYEAMDAVLQ